MGLCNLAAGTRPLIGCGWERLRANSPAAEGFQLNLTADLASYAKGRQKKRIAIEREEDVDRDRVEISE